MSEEPTLCEHCTTRLAANTVAGCDSKFHCPECQKNFPDIEGVVVVTRGQHAKRDLGNRVMRLVRVAYQSEVDVEVKRWRAEAERLQGWLDYLHSVPTSGYAPGHSPDEEDQT